MSQYETFVVRLWTGENAESARGHIQHVASRRGVYFRDAEKMLEFIREYTAPVPLAGANDEGGHGMTAHGEGPQPDRSEADDR